MADMLTYMSIQSGEALEVPVIELVPSVSPHSLGVTSSISRVFNPPAKEIMVILLQFYERGTSTKIPMLERDTALLLCISGRCIMAWERKVETDSPAIAVKMGDALCIRRRTSLQRLCIRSSSDDPLLVIIAV